MLQCKMNKGLSYMGARTALTMGYVGNTYIATPWLNAIAVSIELKREGVHTMSKPAAHCIVQILAISALAFGLAACNKADENQTAGQKLDSAIANTEKAASNAAADASAAATTAADAAKDVATDAKDAAKDAGNAVAAAVDSASITASVNASLIKDTELSAIKIDVDTKDGVVTLTGEAPNQAAKDRAGDIAKAVQGVTAVTNNLTVKAG